MIVVCRVTTECNLSCPFCAYDKRLDIPRNALTAEMATHLGQLLARYQQHTGERVLLSWLGGEPFLWPPLLSLSKTLHQDHELAISVTTNGTSLHRKTIQQTLIENFAELTISLDGQAELHNRLRGWNNGWEKLRVSVTEIAEQREQSRSRLLIRANLLLMHDNIEDFSALCLNLCEWGVNEITFNELGGRDRPEFFPAHRLISKDIDHFSQQLRTLKHTLSKKGVELRGNELYLQRLYTNAEQQSLAHRCNPARDFLFVDEHGRVAPCNFTVADYGVSLDTLHSAEDIINLRQHFLHARKTAPNSACSNCPSTQVFAKFA